MATVQLRGNSLADTALARLSGMLLPMPGQPA